MAETRLAYIVPKLEGHHASERKGQNIGRYRNDMKVIAYIRLAGELLQENSIELQLDKHAYLTGR